MTERLVVGIDLGTTYSLVSVLEPAGPRVLPNALGELLTPSAVHVDEQGRVVVGAAARALAVTCPERTALAFKRDMGTDRTFQLGDKKFTPTELSALVLGSLKHDAETALGRPITEAVVTVPAYFGEWQRRATRDACELAQLKVERTINEPTAAALAYGLHAMDQELCAIVLDLGGGTFDVTVLEIMEGVIEIQSTAGDTRLGGEDFLDALALEMGKSLKSETGLDVAGDRALGAKLREACEHAKCRLSEAESTTIVLGDLPAGATFSKTIARPMAEQLWTPLFERIRIPIARALRDARIGPEQIDEVLLVGGATRMPWVAAMVRDIFGRSPRTTLPPDEAVAMGAAIQAALKSGDEAVSDMVVTDVAPFSLGIAVQDGDGVVRVNGVFAPILDRGTVLPASRVRTFSTVEDNQRQLAVEVYQGEHALCRENQKIGRLEISGIPANRAGQEGIDVRFSYDMNGVLEVDATIASTKKTHSVVIEQGKGRLSPEELSASRERLKRLKFHPREALPNVTALARAEALFVELVGNEREFLSHAMTAMRLGLESQDAARIDAARRQLVEVTAHLRAVRDTGLR